MKVEGRVLNADGNPASGAEVATLWIVHEESGELEAHQGARTDADGRFSMLEELTGESFVLDPHARVSGKVQDAPLDKALDELLRSIGARFEIRDEAVVFTK